MKQLTKPSPRTRRTRQQIGDLLSEFSNTGWTIKEFCSAHHISPGTFHKWQARLKNKPAQQSNRPGFAEVQVGRCSSDALFAEVRCIRIYQPVQAVYLKELLG
jgi:Transposase